MPAVVQGPAAVIAMMFQLPGPEKGRDGVFAVGTLHRFFTAENYRGAGFADTSRRRSALHPNRFALFTGNGCISRDICSPGGLAGNCENGKKARDGDSKNVTRIGFHVFALETFGFDIGPNGCTC